MKQNNTASPTILAIDSSNASCSVAVWKNGAISAYYEELSGALQAQRLMLLVEEALAKSKATYGDLTLVAATVGPGSFTGIRIGLASARAIGFAAGIPVLGFNSLQVMALGVKEEQAGEQILAVLNAGKGETIYQYFDQKLAATIPPTLVVQADAPVQASGITFPRADLLAKLAAHYLQYAVEPVPFYVRPPDAKLPN